MLHFSLIDMSEEKKQKVLLWYHNMIKSKNIQNTWSERVVQIVPRRPPTESIAQVEESGLLDHIPKRTECCSQIPILFVMLPPIVYLKYDFDSTHKHYDISVMDVMWLQNEWFHPSVALTPGGKESRHRLRWWELSLGARLQEKRPWMWTGHPSGQAIHPSCDEKTIIICSQFGCRYSEYWQGMAYTQRMATTKSEDIRKEKWPSQNESRFAFNDPAIHVASNNFAMFSPKNDVMPCRSSEEISWLSMTVSSTETNSLTASQNNKKTYFSPSNYEMKPL